MRGSGGGEFLAVQEKVIRVQGKATRLVKTNDGTRA